MMIRVSLDEYAAIKAKAKDAGFRTVAAYMRHAALAA
jgi:hypothetical protein